MQKLAIAVLLLATVACTGEPAPIAKSEPSSTPLAAEAASASAVPALRGRVNDYANLLSATEAATLSKALAVFERETSHPLALLTVASLGGESIDAFSLRVANAWALGRRDVDNGALLVVSLGERAVRIELGKGFEDAVPNGRALKIVESDIIPAFREGRFGDGIQRGMESLMVACREFKAPP